MRFEPPGPRRALPAELSLCASMRWSSPGGPGGHELQGGAAGQPRYGDKTRSTLLNLDRIFADFPDARSSTSPRSAADRAVVSTMPFGTSSALLNAGCAGCSSSMSPCTATILRSVWKDLVADPRTVLEQILGFVGEPWDDAVLDYLHHSATDDVPPLPWFVGATREQAQSGAQRRQLAAAGSGVDPSQWNA